MKDRKKTKQVGLLTLLLSLMATKLQTSSAYSSDTPGKRWTSCNTCTDYDTLESYTDVDGNTENYRMQWELYEGSIALVQMALVWKEISEESQHQIKRATSQDTREVLRIRRIWQLENCQATYQDETELGTTQNENNFANMEYVNPA